MKAFAVWLLGTLAAFGALGGVYHSSLTGEPRKVLVVVDSSYAMSPHWHRVPDRLREIEDRRYSSLALITEKGRVHGWTPRLSLGQTAPYGPRDFERLGEAGAFPEIAETGRIYFVTNAPADEIEAFGDWEIIRP